MLLALVIGSVGVADTGEFHVYAALVFMMLTWALPPDSLASQLMIPSPSSSNALIHKCILSIYSCVSVGVSITYGCIPAVLRYSLTSLVWLFLEDGELVCKG